VGNSVTFSSGITATTAHMSSINRHISAPLAHIFKLLVVVMAGFIAYQSLAPTNAPGSFNHMDKFVHAAVYCALAFFIAGGWRHSTLLFVFLVTAGFGAALEAGQGVMNLGRTASLADQIANMVGAGLACGVWVIIFKLYHRKRSAT